MAECKIGVRRVCVCVYICRCICASVYICICICVYLCKCVHVCVCIVDTLHICDRCINLVRTQNEERTTEKKSRETTFVLYSDDLSIRKFPHIRICHPRCHFSLLIRLGLILYSNNNKTNKKYKNMSREKK